MKHFLYRIALSAGLAITGSAQAASDFTVLNGTWVVSSEVNGQPGRGMALDVQNGVLVMQVYNYDAQGEPTFHMTSGVIQNNQFNGPLNRYRGGRYFGSPALNAVADGSAGPVEVRFTNAHSGVVQFPGEAPVPISRFNFDGISKSAFAHPGTRQLWVIAQLGSNNEPIDLWSVNFQTERLADGTLSTQVLDARARGSFVTGANIPCTYTEATDLISCQMPLGASGQSATMQLRPMLDSLSGTLINNQFPDVRHALVGGRLHTVYPQNESELSRDAPNPWGHFGGPPFYQPNPGTWIVSSELNGTPGRGMNIDVQQGTLVLQVYNYAQNGAGTFHMATGPFIKGQTTASLKRYSGGRYYGSDPRTGVEAGDAGEVTTWFTSPTQGFIRFPGEPAVAIQRYEFSLKPNPQLSNLLGSWAFLGLEDRKFSNSVISSISNNRAVSTSGMQCFFEDSQFGTVRCTDTLGNSSSGPYYIADYRFTPGVDGRSIGASMVIDAQGRLTGAAHPAAIMRTRNGDGALAGLGTTAGAGGGGGVSTQALNYNAIDDNNTSRPTKAVVTLPATAERRPVVLIAQGWGGSGNSAGAQSALATQLANAGYVAVDVGFNEISPWVSDLPYSAKAALDKLCADLAQRANCDAIIWTGSSYSGTQSLLVTNYLRAYGRPVKGFVSQDAGYTLYWGVPNHANLADYSVALIENMGDSTFPVNACSGGNCGARERATWHRNNGVNTDKILSWCPAGGEHGTRDNVPGGAQGWDNWVISSIKTMLHTHRGVATFTGYTPPNVAVSNACAAP
jgi:hypothetical protein